MYRWTRLFFSPVVFLSVLVMLLPITPAWAWQSNWRFCAHTGVIGAPGGWNVPSIDGVTSNDLGWTRSWRYVFNNGTPVHDVAVQAVADSKDLYLSFEVNNDRALSSNDLIVIALEPGGGGQGRLLHVYPLVNGGVRNPPDFKYWGALPAGGGGGAPPAGTVAAASTSGGGTNNSWVVELKLPKSAFGITASDFGLYFNVMVNQGPGTGPTGLVNEYAWPVPANDNEWLLGDPTALPATSAWGTATVAGTAACNGVSLAQSDIGTTNPSPLNIVLGQKNTFQATVKNNSLDPATGNPTVVAKQITAKFKYATWGLPSVWQDVVAAPGSTNPDGPKDVPANDQETFSTDWNVPANDPSFVAGTKTCILVELDTTAPATSPDWTTVFVNKSNWNNFYYTTASRVEPRPVIDTRRWANPPAGKPHQLELFVMSRIDRIDLETARRSARPDSDPRRAQAAMLGDDTWTRLSKLEYFPVERNAAFKKYGAILDRNDALVSQIIHLTHGCRRSGKFIRIDTQDLEVCERVGSFGVGIRHAGLAAAIWTADIKGAKPVRQDKTHLSMQLGVRERKVLPMVFDAKDRSALSRNASPTPRQ